MYVKIWYDMGEKYTNWIYITHYEFRKVFGLEEPRELRLCRSSSFEPNAKRLAYRIDDTWARLKRYISIDNEYCVVPYKILCVKKP